MNCPHTLHDPDGLRCTRTDAHDPEAVGGHVYATGSGVKSKRHEDDGGES